MGQINTHKKMANDSCISQLSAKSSASATVDTCDFDYHLCNSPPASPAGPLVDPRSPTDGISRTPIHLTETTVSLVNAPRSSQQANVSIGSPFDHLDLEPIDGVHVEHETSSLPDFSLSDTSGNEIGLDSSTTSDSVLVSSSSSCAGTDPVGKESTSKNPLTILRTSFRRFQQKSYTPQQILRRKQKAKYTKVVQNESIECNIEADDFEIKTVACSEESMSEKENQVPTSIELVLVENVEQNEVGTKLIA